MIFQGVERVQCGLQGTLIPAQGNSGRQSRAQTNCTATGHRKTIWSFATRCLTATPRYRNILLHLIYCFLKASPRTGASLTMQRLIQVDAATKVSYGACSQA